jgi:hypothetical protein
LIQRMLGLNLMPFAEDPISFPPAGNEADFIQRREHLAAHTI